VTNTAANSAASGGYGPNQVATALGLGIFILFSRLIITYKNKFVQLLMIIFLAVMIYRGILTFSRGGILTAIIMSLIFIVIYFIYSKITLKFKLLVKLIGVLSMISLIWVISVNQSGGLIENRYANEDSLGREKDDITTGRLDIFITELDSFYKQPFFGVGVGKMKYIRLKETGINAASHNEFSRMLSEHGLFGIISLIILLLVPILNNPFGLKNIYFYPFLFFWILTISHSAMRIAAPAFIYGLCLLTITREKKNFIHRK
jgi:O-antigen ligase